METIINPVVGKKYTVPCIRVSDGEPVPISCEAHWDEDIAAFTDQNIPSHYHLDWRFIDDKLVHHLYINLGMRVFMERDAAFHVIAAQYVVERLEKKLTCVRVAPACIIPSFLKVLKVKYCDHRIDLNNPICPHRGVPLEVNQGKCIAVCQGHGLAWNMRTGKMATTR